MAEQKSGFRGKTKAQKEECNESGGVMGDETQFRLGYKIMLGNLSLGFIIISEWPLSERVCFLRKF